VIYHIHNHIFSDNILLINIFFNVFIMKNNKLKYSKLILTMTVLMSIVGVSIAQANTQSKIDQKNLNVEFISQPGIENEEWRLKMFGDVPSWYDSDAANFFGEQYTPNHLWTYDRDAAVEYADQYALNPNEDYRFYDDSDCTNFASQVLKAGDKPYRSGDRDDNNAWYYGMFKWTTSYSWAASNNLYKHLSEHTESEQFSEDNFSNLEKGDLIFIDFGDNGNMNHTMIISKIDEDGEIYLDYHSSNRYQKPLSWVKEKISESYSNAKFYGININNGCGPDDSNCE